VDTVTYTSGAAATSPATLLQQLTDQGANGYSWLTPIAFTGDAGAQFVIYARSGTTTYTYDVLSMPGDAAQTLDQANSEGARGFSRVTVFVAGLTGDGHPQQVVIYRHIVGSTATYSYESLAAPTTDADFLAQANAEGARGLFFAGVVTGSTGGTAALYVKDSSSTATYAYTTQPLNDSGTAFLTQANAQGALGYRYHGAALFTGQSSSIYVKDTTQSSQFTYSDQPTVTHVADYLTQANAQGASGLRTQGQLQFGASVRDVYFLPTHCTGLLCAPSGAF